HRMVHHGEHTVEELADLLGWSESSLYRASNPHDDAANFPSRKLIPAMRFQQDFGPLQHIASRCGFAIYRLPRRIGRMEATELADIQKAQVDAIHAIHQFIAGELSQAEAIEKIDTAIGGLARGRLAVNHGIKQEELGL
ncbi:MAG: hypothetical protein AUJ57_12090, partial [Zetaproteobacteria bacterium CG1_02_53_45]